MLAEAKHSQQNARLCLSRFLLLLIQLKRQLYSAAASPKVIALILTLRSPRKGVKVGKP